MLVPTIIHHLGDDMPTEHGETLTRSDTCLSYGFDGFRAMVTCQDGDQSWALSSLASA